MKSKMNTYISDILHQRKLVCIYMFHAKICDYIPSNITDIMESKFNRIRRLSNACKFLNMDIDI